MKICKIIKGDSRDVLKCFSNRVNLIVTSPPYADARKKHYTSIHPDNFCDWFKTFHQVFWDSLVDDGSLIINIKDKIVSGVRHRFVWKTILEMEDLGWKCIDDYIWHKTNPMPGYWPTRLRDGWEYCFHLAKVTKPYINQNAVKKPVGDWVEKRLTKLGSNDKERHNSKNDSGFGRDLSKWVDKKTVLPSNVLSVPLVGRNKKHPAVFPIELPEFFIKLLSPENGLILDPFSGSGTTGVAALNSNRNVLLIDCEREYCNIAYENLTKIFDKSALVELSEFKQSEFEKNNLNGFRAELTHDLLKKNRRHLNYQF